MDLSHPRDDTYIIDCAASRILVHAFAGGMLSALGHDPTFAARDFGGEARFDPERPAEASVIVTIQAASLTLTDDVGERDRRLIETAMRDDVLQIATYPEIVYRCPVAAPTPSGPGELAVSLDGELTLHGVTRRQPVVAAVTVNGPVLRASGELSVLQADYEIERVTVAGSMLRVKDALRCSFDIVARR